MESILKTMKQDFIFTPLPLRKHRLIGSDKSRYRVYRKAGDFITVEAKTAYEAFKSSGFSEASRIVRVSSHTAAFLDRSELSDALEAPAGLAGVPVRSSDKLKQNVEQEKPAIPQETFVAAPPSSTTQFVEPKAESIQTIPLGDIEKPKLADDGIEEILPSATPVQFKAPQRTLASESPGAPAPAKPERTMLSVQDIDKLLGK